MTSPVDTRIPTWAAAIDWYGDGTDFAHAIDNVTDDLRKDPGIAIQRGKDSARARARPMVAAGGIELDNQSRDYSAENASSPIYQLVLPDRPSRIQATIGAELDYDAADIGYDEERFYDGTTTIVMMTGLTDEPVQKPARNDRSVSIGILGSMAALRGHTISTSMLYSAIRTDQAIGHVLDLAGWPSADRVISTGDTTLTWWWLDDIDAWSALVALVETEGAGAALYEDGHGRVVFENRNYRSTATRSLVSRALFRDRRTSAEVGYDDGFIDYDGLDTLYDGGGSLGFTDFRYEANLRDIYNDVSHVINRRVAAASAPVWNYGQSLVLGASEVKTVFARSGTGDPWQSISDVTVTTDYVVSAGSLTSVTTTQLSATTVAITFTAGGSGATVLGPASATTGPQLRAVAVPVVSTERIAQSVAGSSLLVTTRSLALQDSGASRELATATAQALVNAAVAYYRNPRPLVTITVVNSTAEELEQIMMREVSDRIGIVEEQTGVGSEFWIEMIRLDGRGNGMVRAEFVCAKTLDTFSPGIWDEALWNVGLWGT